MELNITMRSVMQCRLWSWTWKMILFWGSGCGHEKTLIDFKRGMGYKNCSLCTLYIVENRSIANANVSIMEA